MPTDDTDIKLKYLKYKLHRARESVSLDVRDNPPIKTYCEALEQEIDRLQEKIAELEEIIDKS